MGGWIKVAGCLWVLVSALGCAGEADGAPGWSVESPVDAEPVAFCPGDNIAQWMAPAAERLELDFVLDCEAHDAVHVIEDGPVWDNGRCNVNPEAICVASCTVAGECGITDRIEIALLAAGF